MESLKHRLHYLPFEKFFPSEVRFQNGNGNGDGEGGDTEGGGGGFGPGFGGMAAGGLGSGYGVSADSDGNLDQSAPEFGPELSEGRFIGVTPSVPESSPTLSQTGLGKTVAGIIDVIGSTLSAIFGHGVASIGLAAAEKGTQVASGKSWGQIAVDAFGIAVDAFGNLINASPTVTESQAAPSTPSVPSPFPSLSELSGFPSPGGGGEYPLQAAVPVGATPLSTSSSVEPTLVQAEIAALAKYISSPTEQSLTDVLNQAQFATSSDQAKEEAQKETQSAQLASMLPIMGIILIGAFVAFRKGARA